MREVPYEEETRTGGFEEVMRELMRPIMVHRFAMARIRKDLREGNPHPNRVKSNRKVAAKAQRECEDIMAEHTAHCGYSP